MSRPSSAHVNGSPPKVPGFSVENRLGSGSYASVYRALSDVPGPSGVRETVAIKCVKRTTATMNKIATDNLVQEVAILKKLKHKHIVQLLDFRWDDTYIYLIMEFCNAGDLSKFIKTHKWLPERVARKFLRQLASAMHYLHSQNIAHMDLKPNNLLLSIVGNSNLVLKIADFGFAQKLVRMPDEWNAKDFRGSLLYMAPEIYRRLPYDSSVDLWSIGIILYECLYGQTPFACDNENTLIKHLLSEAPIQLPSRQTPLSNECMDLLLRLLIKNSKQRITFEEFFDHPFIDIKHAPSEQSFALADSAVRDAECARRRHAYSTAVKLYTDALDHYLAALQYTEFESSRNRLRAQMHQVLKRAEECKRAAKPTTDENTMLAKQMNSQSVVDDIRIFWSDTPQVNAALIVAQAAKELEDQDKWQEALDKYTLAVEPMLIIISREQQTERKMLLRQLVEKWLSRAEAIRNYVELDGCHLSSVERKEAEIVEVEAAIDAAINPQANERSSTNFWPII